MPRPLQFRAVGDPEYRTGPYACGLQAITSFPASNWSNYVVAAEADIFLCPSSRGQPVGLDFMVVQSRGQVRQTHKEAMQQVNCLTLAALAAVLVKFVHAAGCARGSPFIQLEML
jgi:hypothetical protein